MTSAVSIENVSRQFADFTALGGVSLDIAAGEFIVLLGPSGCGKTTLLSILGGFLAPSGGRVLVDGKDMTHVAPARRPTTTMFQDYALFPHMTLSDNVGFGLRMRGMARRRGGKRRSPSSISSVCAPRPARSRMRFPAVSGSASRSPARLRSIRRCCCSMSRSARSISSCAGRCRMS